MDPTWRLGFPISSPKNRPPGIVPEPHMVEITVSRTRHIGPVAAQATRLLLVALGGLTVREKRVSREGVQSACRRTLILRLRQR